MEKEMRMKEMKTGELFEELLLDIFSRVPSKQLTRMKCVSKDWCSLISDLQSSSLQTIASGLIRIQQYEDDDYDCDPSYPLLKTQFKVFDVKDQGGELVYLENNALGFTLYETDTVESLCCSNGLLLCCYEINGFNYSPFLYDLFLKEPISLPSSKEFAKCEYYGIGLAFDGNRNHPFKVVCFSFTEDVKFLDCMIFSSEAEEWSKHRPLLKNSSIIQEDFGYNFYSETHLFRFESLHHGGCIYWSICGYFLVYNLKDSFFEIYNLPIKAPPVDECFWVFEGCLHYCYSGENRFYVWTWIKEEERDCEGSWKLKHRVDLETLKAQHPEFPSYIKFLKPYSFNKDFQTLYLLLTYSLVVAYSFETGCLREVEQNHR